MTRLELLKILVGQARTNGFEFRRWYATRLGITWESADAAFHRLESERRYYALLFSHDFARAFWKSGAELTFQVPTQTFQRVMPDGSTATVTRKAFTRRSTRRDAWRYHLRQMAATEEPLRYIRKYLAVEGDLDADPTETAATPSATRPKTKKVPRPKPVKRPLPEGIPGFLRRPFP